MRPEDIDIMGRDYTIEYIEPHPGFETKCSGKMIPDERRILIESCAHEERNTLIHEVLHCIDQIMEAELTEKQISQLANGLEVFILKNPECIKYLMLDEEEKHDGLACDCGARNGGIRTEHGFHLEQP
jgi:hypothetical protein